MSKFNFNIDIDNHSDSLLKSNHNSISQYESYEDSYFVDLDLPSGLLWCKYNLGCDYDLMLYNYTNTKASDWYGGYYAWGETEPKEEYSKTNYKFGTKEELRSPHAKYTTGICYRDTYRLQPEDDAASVYNKTWRIPTILDINELIDNTKKTWYKDFLGIEELYGYVFESLKDSNKNIFVPAAGYEVNKDKHHGYYGYYWASTLYTATHDQECASCMQIGQDLLNTNGTPRQFGISIRPVKMK